MCLFIGYVVFLNDEVSSFDTRFQMRGDQIPGKDILVVVVKPQEIRSVASPHDLLPEKGRKDYSDNFYWEKKIWLEVLRKLIKGDPQKIGITFFFSDNIKVNPLTPEEYSIFTDPKVLWSAQILSHEKLLSPLFTNIDQENIGVNDFVRDEDGVIRKYAHRAHDLPHLAERMANSLFPPSSSRLINYRGYRKVFEEVSFADIQKPEFDQRVLKGELKNKFILIGPHSFSRTEYLTPFGPYHRAGIMAHLVDNISNKRGVTRAPTWIYMVGFFLLLLLAGFIIITYPQSIALIVFIWMSTMVMAFSAWIFDSFFFWIPVVSPLVQLIATWVVFTAYQANKIERKHWDLQQEQKYFQEIEQLKNNFISLFSHDLKTPIAKIQAIVDRLITQNSPHTLAIHQDLKSLRIASQELHRYIQSILKVIRVESREFKIHVESHDINQIIDETVTQLLPLAKEKGILIQTKLEPLFLMEFDHSLVKEVVLNLIENAIKYTPVGGVVKVWTQEKQPWVEVFVEDNGIGIPEDEISRIWNKFSRGKEQELRTSGSGLGLYLVKYFIELHGGEVHLESQLKKGTKVIFKLPLDGIQNTTRLETQEKEFL